MGKPSAPKPSDPRKTAAAQTGQNVATAIANQRMGMVDQVGPNGSLTYTQNGTDTFTDPNSGETYEIPRYTATTSLNEIQQATNDAGQEAQLGLAQAGRTAAGRLEDLFGSDIDLSGAPERGGLTNDGSLDRGRVEAALFERMQPGLDRTRDRLESRLASQGIRIGSEAYSAAMEDAGRQENDARLSAIINAGGEQSRAVNTDIARMDAQNRNRTGAISEAYAGRSQPMNEIMALLGGSQVRQPNFVNTPTGGMATTDFAGLQANADNQAMNAYNQRMSQYNSTVGGLMGLGGSFLLGR